MNIYVGGANGVGKSTILRRAAQIDKRLEVIHFTSALMQELNLPPGDYDALHAVANPIRDAAMAKIISGLVARKTTKLRLIDGHYLNIIWGNVHEVTKSWVSQLDALVLVKADAKVVWRRIRQDEILRDRELFSKGLSDEGKLKQLTDYLAATETEFNRLIKLHQKDHFVLTHNDEDIDRAARQLINFINTIKA